MGKTVLIRLTEEQIRLIRETISQKVIFISRHPLPEDGDLKERLNALDKPFHSAMQTF